MTEVEARAQVAQMTDAAGEPPLSAADLDSLIRQARRVDSMGRLPSDPDWEPTYSLPYAAAKGWELKAGRLANKFMFMSGGKMFSRNQMFRHCQDMARTFRSQLGVGAIRMSRGSPPFR
jgi:hypothetical protein